MKPTLIFMMGPTNVGKTSLMNDMQLVGGKRNGLVQVGNMMRAKYLDPKSPHYDPNHFIDRTKKDGKNSAAPAHTQLEAWQMMIDGIHLCEKDPEIHYIFIDGQPRDFQQCEDSMKLPYKRIYISLYAPEKVREERARKRDAGNPVKLQLSMERMRGDIPITYELTNMLGAAGECLLFYRTDMEPSITKEILLRVAAITGRMMQEQG